MDITIEEVTESIAKMRSKMNEVSIEVDLLKARVRVIRQYVNKEIDHNMFKLRIEELDVKFTLMGGVI